MKTEIRKKSTRGWTPRFRKSAAVAAGFLAFCLAGGAVGPEEVLTATLTAPVRDAAFSLEVEKVEPEPLPEIEVPEALTEETPQAAAQETPAAAATPVPAKAAAPGVTPKTISVSASAGSFEKMKAYQAKYPDVVGYINIPGTNIDHPVVQASSNLYYEHLDLNKNYSKNGVIWADQDVKPNSSNTIVYGHNWTNYTATPRVNNPNDVMFGQLTGYQYASFAQSHPTIQYANENGDATWVVFGAMYTTDISFYLSASLSPTYLAKKAKQLNLYSIDVDVKDTDQVLTLSTCTRYFGKFENQRFLVMARKLREGEKASVKIG